MIFPTMSVTNQLFAARDALFGIVSVTSAAIRPANKSSISLSLAKLRAAKLCWPCGTKLALAALTVPFA